MRRADGQATMDARPPPLGTPPGSPPGSAPTSDDEGSASPPRAPSGTLPASACKYALADGAESKQEEMDDDELFHDVALDAGVVTKSIFKEKRGGFLSRLRDASSSIVKTKYAPSEAAIVLPANAPPPPPPRESAPFSKEESEQIHRAMRPGNESVEIVLEEEEPIDVAIDQTATMRPQQDPSATTRIDFGGGATQAAFSTGVHNDDDDDSGVAPQVVIHSTESDSDSGFATLNPIISRQAQGRRGSTSSAIATGPAIGSSPRVLLSLPIDEEASTSDERLVLVINALGATGLAKVEKFGTQSTQLEMRLRESTDDLSSGASHLSFLRTSLHKKGGSEAQWNQQFTTGLRSKTKQLLHIAVRTHSKLLVGEAEVSLASVGETLYDQHYPIYRTENGDRRGNVGQVHLQLQVIPAAHFAPLNSSNATRETNRSVRSSPGPIPPVLRQGALMFKVPYHTHSLMGAAPTKRQWIAVAGDGPGETVCVTWCDPIDTTEKSRRLDVCLITEIREGARTKAFERLLQSEPSSVAHERDRCFSIVSKSRTLDLVASSKEEARIWIEGLRRMVFGDESQDPNCSDPSVKTIEEFRHSALTTRDPATLSAMSTTAKKEKMQQWRSTIFDFARRGEVDFIATCLLDGCPIDLLETGSGDTLLMLACRLGDARLVELCLQWRAKNDPHPEFGETALQVAVNTSHSDCLSLILKTAAESEMDSEIVNHIDPNNDAPLHVAARKGDLACMQLLLHHGADICVVEEFGRTPLHCAVMSRSLDCVAYLLDVGGDSVLNAGDHDGDTALHYASLDGTESIVKLLLESAADVQAANVHGETALDLARRDKHPAIEKLIAQYHHANTAVPAIRNDPASSLLMLHQKNESLDNDEATDAMDYGDEEDDLEDQDPEAFIEPSNSPVRRGPIEHLHSVEMGYDDEDEYYVPHSGRSSTSSRSTQPISPSARIREVLATHRQRTSLHHPVPVPPLHFHSARDDIRSRYMLEHDYVMPSRQAYTERIPREDMHYRAYPHPRYPSQEHYYRPYERSAYPYIEDRVYSHSPAAVRRHSMSPHAYDGFHQYPRRDYDDYNEWYGQEPHPSFASRRPSTAEVQPHPRQTDAWHNTYAQHVSQAPTSTPAPTQPVSAPADEWDMYYSDQGYPYYVNRSTGESQWENPYEVSPISPPSSAAQVAPHTIENTVSASSTPPPPTISSEAQVRIRLAAAREMKVSETQRGTTEVPSSVNKATDALETPTYAPKALSISTSLDEIPSAPSSPSCESPSSKYESRTGMKLSIDVASPQRKDENRPVYVASPRARSPRQTAKGSDRDISDSSFEKSTRASSPRGKSKNIQIIELKRANNLAMALASFKINDRNDQIVQALTTLDERIVNAELLVCLQRYFPTDDEAAQLRSYEGPVKSLGPAERFFFQLLQVPDVFQRIECFLYKLQFARNYRSAYSKIQATKRTCRDLVENYSFVQALSEFFKKAGTRTLQVFRSDSTTFRKEYLSRIDEKLHSFHDDLQKASEIELLDVELQINRLITGSRTVQAFVDKTNPPKDQDVAAHDILHRFLAETRGKLTELEVDYEALGQWEIKVLDLFGESKASCQLTSILECLCSMLDKS